MQNTALIRACQEGNYNAVERLLENITNINAYGLSGHTALMTATSYGHSDIVMLLLDHRVEKELPTLNTGHTALMIASEHGYCDIVKQLVQAQANVNASNRDGSTALTCATENGFLDIVKVLIAYGADVNTRTKRGTTPLMYTCQDNHLDIATWLLRCGANVDYHTRDHGHTALIIAAQKGYCGILKELINYEASIDAQDHYGATALIYASKKCHYSIVKLLMQYGANVRIKTKNGKTALNYALQYGHTDIVKLLQIQERTLTPSRNKQASSRSSLDVPAARNGKDTATVGKNIQKNVSSLCENIRIGLQIDSTHRSRSIGMPGVMRRDNVEIPQEHTGNNHLTRSFFVLNKDPGKVPKMSSRCMQQRQTSVGSGLIASAVAPHNNTGNSVPPQFEDKGRVPGKNRDNFVEGSVKFHEKNYEGEKSLLVANTVVPKSRSAPIDSSGKCHSKKEENYCDNVKAQIPNMEELRQLQDLDDREFTALMAASEKKLLAKATELLDKGHINASKKYGWTILMIAAQKGYSSVVKLLLDHKAHLDSCNEDGLNALLLGCENGHTEIASMLLEKGADVKTTDKRGWGALMISAENGRSHLVKILLTNFYDAFSSRIQDALMVAAEHGHEDVVGELLTWGGEGNKPDTKGNTPLVMAAQGQHWNVIEILKHFVKNKDVTLSKNQPDVPASNVNTAIVPYSPTNRDCKGTVTGLGMCNQGYGGACAIDHPNHLMNDRAPVIVDEQGKRCDLARLPSTVESTGGVINYNIHVHNPVNVLGTGTMNVIPQKKKKKKVNDDDDDEDDSCGDDRRKSSSSEDSDDSDDKSEKT